MSILIKGMEMPQTCRDCRFSTVIAFDKRPLCDALVEYMSYGEWEAKRLDNCPLVPAPPHGRLIDADAFLALINDSTTLSDFLKCIINPLIRGEPTIIPADEQFENSEQLAEEVLAETSEEYGDDMTTIMLSEK